MNRKNIKEYNKLVRDKIPQIIESDGKFCKYRQLSEQEYSECLKKKLVEEADEFLQSENIEELADLYEVVNAIVALNGWTFKQIEEIAQKKTEKRGAFTKRIFLEKAEV